MLVPRDLAQADDGGADQGRKLAGADEFLGSAMSDLSQRAEALSPIEAPDTGSASARAHDRARWRDIRALTRYIIAMAIRALLSVAVLIGLASGAAAQSSKVRVEQINAVRTGPAPVRVERLPRSQAGTSRQDGLSVGRTAPAAGPEPEICARARQAGAPLPDACRTAAAERTTPTAGATAEGVILGLIGRSSTVTQSSQVRPVQTFDADQVARELGEAGTQSSGSGDAAAIASRQRSAPAAPPPR